MTNRLNMPKPATCGKAIQALWLTRIVADQSLWGILTLNSLRDSGAEPVGSRLLEALQGFTSEGLNDGDLSLAQFLSANNIKESDVLNHLAEDRAYLETFVEGRWCVTPDAEHNLRMIQSVHDLTDVEARCFYWVWYNCDSTLAYFFDSLNIPDFDLSLYSHLCAVAFDLNEEEVSAAFAPEGKLRRCNLIEFKSSSGSSCPSNLSYWFSLPGYELQNTLSTLPLSKDEWLQRWLKPCHCAVKTLPIIDELPGLKSVIEPMLAHGIEKNEVGLHLIVRSKDKGIGRLFAFHLANTLNVPLYHICQDDNYASIEEANKITRLFSNLPFIGLFEDIQLSLDDFTSGKANTCRPCIWLSASDEWLNPYPIYPIIDLHEIENDIRDCLIETLAGKLLTASQRRLIARTEDLPIESVVRMIEFLKTMKADKATVADAIKLLTNQQKDN